MLSTFAGGSKVVARTARLMAQASGNLPSANDPRVSAILRWSAGLSGPIIMLLLVGVGSLLVNLRDESREMKIEIRSIAKSDTEQKTDIKDLKNEQNTMQLKLSEHAIRLRAAEAKLGLR